MKTQVVRNNRFCVSDVLQHTRYRGGSAVRLFIFAGAFGVLAATPAAADDVLAGSDGWTTPPGSEAREFCFMCAACPTCHGSPIPAGFFGPGSDPFDDVIMLEGDPLDLVELDTIDTIVERLDDAVLSECPSEDTIQIEMVALSLKTVEPITATYNGETDCEANPQNCEEWDVKVCLSDCYFTPDPACPDLLDCPGLLERCPDSQELLVGCMTIRRECPDGGTFDSTLPVLAKFIFSPVAGGADRILDAGLEGACPDLLEPGNTRWTHDAGALAPPTVPAGVQVDGNCDGVDGPPLAGTSNFVPGLGPVQCECDAPADPCRALEFTGEEVELAGHDVLPGVPEDIYCCCPDGACIQVDDVAACVYGRGGTVVVGGGASCDEGELGDCLLPGCVLTSRCCCELRGGEWSDPKTTDCDPPPCPPPPECGNNVKEAGEECDPPGSPCPEGRVCRADCTCPPRVICGDLVCEGGEDPCICSKDCPGLCKKTIPTVSEWGLAVTMLLVLVAGTIVFRLPAPGRD